MGLSGRVPHRVGAATKAALLDLFDQALEAGWPLRRACRVVELPQRRAHRWIARRARGQLADQPPGGSPVHGLLAEEAEEILALPVAEIANRPAMVGSARRTCWLGGTTWRGQAAMRISVSNWSTDESDVDRSVEAILRCAAQADAARSTELTAPGAG